ncbi:MAG: hypothetical protein QMB97_08725 [Pseudomonas sp.]|jgi:toxin CptA|nr:hypothetical protein [Thiopseudomonas sp.]NLU13727.1 hypothetical protein [Gammaproteobacteria bacterium]
MRRRNNKFTCHWQPSLWLSGVAVVFSVLACVAVLWSALQWFYKLGFLTLLLSQIIWQLRQLLQVQQPSQRRGLRCSEKGWQLWDAQRGWQSVQLRADSIATPTLVLLRYRRADQWFYRTLLVAVDSLSADSYRRLRVRLKFSRQRWRALR